MNIIIIGGSDAGISAGLQAIELCPDAQVTLLVADAYPNFSICGLPFYLSGEVAHWKQLAHRTAADLQAAGLNVLERTMATRIFPKDQVVQAAGPDGPLRLPYDRLLIATGARSRTPPIKGLDTPGVFLLRWMDDARQLQQFIENQHVQSAAIIGGGYIGMEMADALTKRGIQVSLLEYQEHVLTTLDASLGKLVEGHLKDQGIKLVTRCTVQAITPSDAGCLIQTDSHSLHADLVLVATGSQPEVALAKDIGLPLGEQGAIRVTQKMETALKGIYAAGDCVQTWHRLLQQHVYLPLGSTAHKQGRVAGENMVGGERLFQGSLGTQVVKIFDLVVGRTGLKEQEAYEAGYAPMSLDVLADDHKAYYPGATPITLRITADWKSGKLLGAQLAGSYRAEISKRIDIFAAALYEGLTVEALNDLDLSYTPPLSSPWDPVQVAAQAWSKAQRSMNVRNS